MKFCPECGSPLATAVIDGERERVRCSAEGCHYVFWDNPTPVVAAIVEIGGQVVLARNKNWPEKMFGLITGFLERGETPEQCVLREVKEELGLDGTIQAFLGNYSFFDFNQIILVFHIRAEGNIALGAELADVKLLPPERVRPWSRGTGPALRDWLNARGI